MGCSFKHGGAHASRTIMLDELSLLFDAIPDPAAPPTTLAHAIVDDNVLGKRSAKTRLLTLRHLRDLYTLDAAVPIFSAMRRLWQRDAHSRALLALLCAWMRDPLLRSMTPPVLDAGEGAMLTPTDLAARLDALEPGRFSPRTLHSTAQNILATFTKTGHVRGRARKYRARAQATPTATAYALWLAHLAGARGAHHFDHPITRLLDAPAHELRDLAETAASMALLRLNHLDAVVELHFPDFPTTRQETRR